MNLNEAHQLAHKLMDKHELLNKGWYFKFDNAKKRFGICWKSKKMISLSKHLTKLNNKKHVKDVILHEIAHALSPVRGHNKYFYAICKKIGATPSRCYSNEVKQPDSPYKLICNNCGYSYNKYRKTKREHSCGKCSPGKFNRKFLLEFVGIQS